MFGFGRAYCVVQLGVSFYVSCFIAVCWILGCLPVVSGLGRTCGLDSFCFVLITAESRANI